MQKNNDDIFCEVALDLNFISQTQIDSALEKKMVDEAIGKQKPLSAYFFDAGLLTEEQIAKVLKIKTRYSSPAIIEDTIAPNLMVEIEVLEEKLTQANVVSKNVWFFPKIDKDIEALHRSMYACKNPAEQTIMIINNKPWWCPQRFWTGILVTDHRIYYHVLKKSFWAAVFPSTISGHIDLKNISSVEIGDIDTCFGSNYVGHELVINTSTIGYVRMGMNVFADDNVNAILASLFAYLGSVGRLSSNKPL